ncbi:hypothetical protein Golomagni_04156 [Golovinomyces magnicellulatus]|nr:hypothetical protein Golomagni_04156 [Golovinomyces magnicellulatus]
MPTKRKLELFDPNKSDSNDTDFEPDEPHSKRSRKQSKKRTVNSRKRPKRARYQGSDVSDEEEEDSLLEESFSDSSQEEDEPELNPITGRVMRKASKKNVNYEEDSESDLVEALDEIDPGRAESKSKKNKHLRRNMNAVEEQDKENDAVEGENEGITVNSISRTRTRMVTLKIGTQQRGLRSIASVKKNDTRQSSDSVSSANIQVNPRLHAKYGDKSVSHNPVGEQIGHSSEQILWQGATREPKEPQKPASFTEEELQETSSYNIEAEDTTMATEFIASDAPEENTSKSQIVELNINTDDRIEAKVGNSQDAAVDDEDEDDDIPTTRRRKGSRLLHLTTHNDENNDSMNNIPNRRLARGLRSNRRKKGVEVGSDFEPPDEASEDEPSKSNKSPKKKGKGLDSESSPGDSRRRSRHTKSKSVSRRRASSDSADDELDQDEIAEELHDLKEPTRRRRQLRREDSEVLYERAGRARNKVDYTIKPLEQLYAADDDAENAAPTPSKRATGGRNGAHQPWERSLFSTFGPFGGGGGPAPVIGGPWGTGTLGGPDSDSSDDDNIQPSTGVGGTAGITPTSGAAHGLLPGQGQSNSLEVNGGSSGNPANFGKIKSQKDLADADPLGVDQNVDFSKVGGLQNHINQLKEMVQMPLLYPELFLKFHVTPPRGVLFHGPPGTGKTLLARALAASVGSRGQKITFYMRKGADALSKWVGEAERQLRLLFEEARKTQPSIIFFDEIDGLAPVRSSKQEQIHASIVSTLLALMDGMDGRGQVIVIGATNRPDNIDPALRRPGRFDREFYFPLPDLDSRKSIINIHTKDWGLDESFKDSLAQITKGYGGADLRALCTEAALNSIQRTFPQIYSSNDKLKIDANKIKVTAKDFMLSVKKMIPSSERSTSTGAAPLPKAIEPLLRKQLKQIKLILDELISVKKKTTALEEAMYEQYDDEDYGFGREKMQQDFERSRIFRPRLLIQGEPGMGQSYLGGAILSHFEGLHVQNFDLATLYSDSNRSPEAALVQLFAEVKRHKPSVIYLPSVETWYHTLSDAAITTFLGLLRGIPPTDPILVLGIADSPANKISRELIRDVFGYSRNNRLTISHPSKSSRFTFFSTIGDYVKKSPRDFPEPMNRKKRKLEVLELAPAPVIRTPTVEEIKQQKKKDHHLLNLLKIAIQPIMEQIQKKYRKFRTPVISQNSISYIFDEKDPNIVRSDIDGVRPYKIDTNKDGVVGLREVATGKFFYNLETTTIEERLSNGFYARPKDFLADIRYLAKDAKRIGDKERILKAQELLTNVEIDIALIEQNPTFADCENLYLRQLHRFREKSEKNKNRALNTQKCLINESDAAQPVEKHIRTSFGSNRTSCNNLTLNSLMNDYQVDEGPAAPTSVEDIVMEGTEYDVGPSMQPPTRIHMNYVPNSGSSRPSVASLQKSIPNGTPHESSSHDVRKLNPIIGCSDRIGSGNWAGLATNGNMTQVSSSPPHMITQDSDIPDTQRNNNIDCSQDWPSSQVCVIQNSLYNSQSTSNSSQVSHITQAKQNFVHTTLPFTSLKSHPTGMANILNESSVEPVLSSLKQPLPPQQAPYETLNLDPSYIETHLQHFAEKSHGCSVEELEQIYRELMNGLWQMRGNWNRNYVMSQLVTIFNDTIHDIEEMRTSFSIHGSPTDLVFQTS